MGTIAVIERLSPPTRAFGSVGRPWLGGRLFGGVCPFVRPPATERMATKSRFPEIFPFPFVAVLMAMVWHDNVGMMKYGFTECLKRSNLWTAFWH